MPPNRAAVLKARAAQRPNTGGTSAPPRTAKGPSTHIAANQQRGGIGPGAPAPLGAAPAAASAPPPVHMPWDAQYERVVGGADKNYGNTMAYLNSKRLQAQQAYGIAPGFNDYANNPFSRAALLRKSWDTNVRGTTNSYAAQGQLYAGSVHNAQQANRFKYDTGYDELNRDYLADVGQIDREGAEAAERREGTINDAGWQRLQSAQGEPLEPQTAPGVRNKAKQKHQNKKKGKK